MNKLNDANRLLTTPYKDDEENRVRTTCYDDRVILQYAFDKDGLALSCDNFADLTKEHNGNSKIQHQI